MDFGSSSFDLLSQIAILVVVIGLIWTIIRFVFRLAMKLFLTGCSVILILGLLAYIYQFLTSP